MSFSNALGQARFCHPNGPAFPNIGGAHARHLALNNGAGTLVGCGTVCHFPQTWQ